MKTKDYLIGKYYDGDTTAEEETTLRMMLADDDSADGRLLRAFEEIYDMVVRHGKSPQEVFFGMVGVGIVGSGCNSCRSYYRSRNDTRWRRRAVHGRYGGVIRRRSR